MSASAQSDYTTYAPFVLLDTDDRSLYLSEEDMLEKAYIFTELEDEGWQGNGYDWESIARAVLEDQLYDLDEEIDFDCDAGLFSASGSRNALEQLGRAMQAVYHDEDLLREMLGRAEPA